MPCYDKKLEIYRKLETNTNFNNLEIKDIDF